MWLNLRHSDLHRQSPGAGFLLLSTMTVPSVVRPWLRLGRRQKRLFATHSSHSDKDCSSITPPYKLLTERLSVIRDILGNRPLTLAEKILYSHVHKPQETLDEGKIIRGETYLQLSPERVAMQDASAQ